MPTPYILTCPLRPDTPPAAAIAECKNFVRREKENMVLDEFDKIWGRVPMAQFVRRTPEGVEYRFFTGKTGDFGK